MTVEEFCSDEISNESFLIDSTVEALLSIHKQSRQSPTNIHNSQDGDDEVLAYAKLNGDGWQFYVNKLSIVLGGSSRTDNENFEVDACLKGDASFASKHARIEYNFISSCWQLIPLANYNIWLNDSPVTNSVAIKHNDKINLSGCCFTFCLPATNASTVLGRSIQSLPISTTNIPHFSNPLNRVHADKNEYLYRGGTESTNDSKPVSRNYNERAQRKKARLIFIPTHDDDVDWKSEKADPKKKPPYSYASLIAEAILSCKERKMTLNRIYKFIQENYSYYRYAHNGWQNSVRHNLSLNDAFIKLARDIADTGKGMYWTVDLKYVLNAAQCNQITETENEMILNTTENERISPLIPLPKSTSASTIYHTDTPFHHNTYSSHHPVFLPSIATALQPFGNTYGAALNTTNIRDYYHHNHAQN